MQCTSRPATLPVSRPLPESRSQTRRTMFADFAAHGRSSLNCRELHWAAPVKLAAVQPSPWLYSGSYRPTQKGNKERTKKTSTRKRERETYPEREGGPGTAQRNKQTNSMGKEKKRQRTAKRQTHPQPLQA